MDKEIIETVRNLNRVNLLYKHVIRYGKPYKVAFVRKIFENMLSDAVIKFSVNKFDCKNYTNMFPSNPRLEIVRMKKEEAAIGGAYEKAASLRDVEIALLRSMLLSIGVNKNDRFFVNSNRIYEFL